MVTNQEDITNEVLHFYSNLMGNEKRDMKAMEIMDMRLKEF